MRAVSLVTVLLCSAPALAQESWETFSDKGGTFIRAGTKQGLKVGSELWMFKTSVDVTAAGKATVMEAFDTMSRLSVDAAALSAGAHFARLPGTTPAVGVLKGHATRNVMNRLTLYNETDGPWTDCLLTLTDGRFYKLAELKPNGDEGIMMIKFMGPPDPPLDFVKVKCAEGEAKFLFKDPSAKTVLKGYAEHAGGRITLFNKGTTAWTRCKVTKPDGSFYVMDELHADDHDSIASTRFFKEGVNETTVEVRCAQGVGTFKIQ